MGLTDACAHASVDHQALSNATGDAAAGECHGLWGKPWTQSNGRTVERSNNRHRKSHVFILPDKQLLWCSFFLLLHFCSLGHIIRFSCGRELHLLKIAKLNTPFISFYFTSSSPPTCFFAVLCFTIFTVWQARIAPVRAISLTLKSLASNKRKSAGTTSPVPKTTLVVSQHSTAYFTQADDSTWNALKASCDISCHNGGHSHLHLLSITQHLKT